MEDGSVWNDLLVSVIIIKWLFCDSMLAIREIRVNCCIEIKYFIWKTLFESEKNVGVKNDSW